MDTWGFDGEDYVAAIRAGAIDPFGSTADELQESLDDFDREMSERIATATDAELEASFTAGVPIPPLRREPESPFQERFRLDEQFVGRMRAIEAQSARVEGERRAVMATHMQRLIDMTGDAGPQIKELAAMAAVELGLTGYGMAGKMTDAWTVVTELPAAHRAAAEGRITVQHLRVIEGETRAMRVDANVSPQEKTRVIDALVAVAEATSTSRLRDKAKQLVNDVLTEPLQIRHDTARQRRRVGLFDASDGMADFVFHGPALEGAAIMDRLTQAARRKPKDDPRTFDQFRADAFQELMLAGVVPENLHGTASITAHVAITIPATTLLEDEYEHDSALRELQFPAKLDGTVLVDADTARRLAGATAVWERLFTDPVTGVAVTVDTYRPGAAQRRLMLARDVRCRMPGCGRPARTADLDHTRDFAKGGTTSLDNLAHLCRRDHTLKHDTRWKVEQRPGGVLRWTSPIGQIIEDVPEPVGPVFTDMPRSRPKPVRRTRAERQRQQRELAEQIMADAAPPGGRTSDGTPPALEWGGPNPHPPLTPF